MSAACGPPRAPAWPPASPGVVCGAWHSAGGEAGLTSSGQTVRLAPPDTPLRRDGLAGSPGGAPACQLVGTNRDPCASLLHSCACALPTALCWDLFPIVQRGLQRSRSRPSQVQLELEARPACFEPLPARRHCCVARASLGRKVRATVESGGAAARRRRLREPLPGLPSQGQVGAGWQVLQGPRGAAQGDLGTEAETCWNLSVLPPAK